MELIKNRVGKDARLRKFSFIALLSLILFITPLIMGAVITSSPDLKVSENNFEAHFSSLNTQIIDYYQVLYPDGSGEAHQILRLNTSDEDTSHVFKVAVSYNDAVFGGAEVVSAYEWKDNITSVVSGPFKSVEIEKISGPIDKPELVEQDLDSDWRDRLETKLDSKVIPSLGYDIKSYGLELVPNSTVDIHLWVKHSPEQKDKMYVSILGSEGGTSLLWDNATFTVRSVSGNIWWRDIDFTETISGSTKLVFPHGVTDNGGVPSPNNGEVFPVMLEYANGTNIGHSMEWPVTTHERGSYDITRYNISDVSWTLDRDYVNGDEVRIAFGKLVNFSYMADNNTITVDDLTPVPNTVILNISSWNQSTTSNGYDFGSQSCSASGCNTGNCNGGSTGCDSGCHWNCGSNADFTAYGYKYFKSHEQPQSGTLSSSGASCAAAGGCCTQTPSTLGSGISYNFNAPDVWQLGGSRTDRCNDCGSTGCSSTWYEYLSSAPSVTDISSVTVFYYPNKTSMKVNANSTYDDYYDWRGDSDVDGSKFNRTGNATKDLSDSFNTGNNFMSFSSDSSEGTGLLYMFFEHQDEANNPPVWSDIADWSIDEEGYVTPFTIDLSSNISDEDNDTVLQISWEENDISAVKVDSIDNVTNVIQFSTVANQSGNNNITLYLVDSEGLTTPESFVITVNPVDDTPNFDTETYDDSSEGSKTNQGDNVTFTANISDPDVDDQIALLVCDDYGISGTSCLGLQYCRYPLSSFTSEGFVSCKNQTDWAGIGDYPWTSFALDDENNVVNGSAGIFHVNLTGDYPLNPEMYINDVLVWNHSDFFAVTETTNNFADEINDYLSSCTPVDGYCDVPIVLHSDSVGILKVDNIGVYMNVTEYTWDTSSLSEGTQYKVRVMSTDGDLNSSWDESDADFTISHAIFGNKTFYVKDSSGDNKASFDDDGNLELAGTCNVSTCDDISSALFVVKDSSDNANAYIDTSGNLCIETGDCSGQSANCSAPDNSFVVRDVSDKDVAYIDSTGDLCLKGSLIENGSP